MKTIELITEEKSNYFMREAFNTLRTNILFSGKDVKTIVVTSCMAHEGKTTISFETSRSLAESGKRVLLVDADLRKSVMASRLTKERGITGLSQLLSGQISTEQAIYHTNIEGLDVIFAGPYPPNPTELVGSTAFKELISENRDRYDYIIIDAAPLGLVIDAAVMATCCDGAVVVINEGRIKYRMAQSVKEQLEKSGCRILGVVLNQIDRKRSVASSDTYYGSKYESSYYGYAGKSEQKSVRPNTSSVSGGSSRTAPKKESK